MRREWPLLKPMLHCAHALHFSLRPLQDLPNDLVGSGRERELFVSPIDSS